MKRILRTNSENEDFKTLTQFFDEYLVEIDGDEKDFYAQYNHIYLENTIICFDGEIASGCGAFKKHENNVAEIKRMFVLPEQRGKGIAMSVLAELETWAKELGYTTCILETSIRLENAIKLYKKLGYEITENYGQYVGLKSSVCMKKIIK